MPHFLDIPNNYKHKLGLRNIWWSLTFRHADPGCLVWHLGIYVSVFLLLTFPFHSQDLGYCISYFSHDSDKIPGKAASERNGSVRLTDWRDSSPWHGSYGSQHLRQLVTLQHQPKAEGQMLVLHSLCDVVVVQLDDLSPCHGTAHIYRMPSHLH